MKKRLVALIAVLALALCIPAAAFASNSAFDAGSSSENYVDSYTGNAFIVDRGLTDTQVKNDLYWAGSSFDADRVSVGANGSGSALIAGQNLIMKNSTIADSLRMAAYSIDLSAVTVGNNLTLAGSSISLDPATSGKGLYIAANDIQVKGHYVGGVLAGSSVVLNATFDGDVRISAGTIEIGKDAVITGELTVPENATVNIDGAAQVGKLTKSESVDTAAVAESSSLYVTGIQMLYSLMAHIVLVGLFFFLMRGVIMEGARMTEERLGPILITGCVIFFLAPVVALLLLFPLITIPIVVLMALVMLAVWLFAIPLAGAIIGCRLFKKMNPIWAGVLGTIIFTVATFLPYMSIAVPTVCTIFVAGFFGQKFLISRRARKMRPQGTNEAQQQVFDGGQQQPPQPPQA